MAAAGHGGVGPQRAERGPADELPAGHDLGPSRGLLRGGHRSALRALAHVGRAARGGDGPGRPPSRRLFRAERWRKDELFPSYDPFHVRVFPLGSVEAGYRYELPIRGPVAWGLGASGAIALLPEFLANEYGRRPLSYWIFASARLR